MSVLPESKKRILQKKKALNQKYKEREISALIITRAQTLLFPI